jgi:hypothetical protein
MKYCGGGCPGHDPDPASDLLTTCDKSSKYFLPFIAHEYDKLLEINTQQDAQQEGRAHASVLTV